MPCFNLILTCTNCRKSSAVQYGFQISDFTQEKWIEWGCVRCDTNHRWLIPPGRTVEDTARESLKHSIAHKKVRDRKDVYTRICGVPQDERERILFGELIWWWRNEAGLGQADAAAAAGITSREWMRVEAGKSLPRENNLERIVHAARGSMDQAFLIIGSARNWKQEFIKRVQSFQARIAEQEHFNVDARKLEFDPDVEWALRAFRRVLPVEPDDNRFLFLAHAIHQAYWTRLLGGTITVDDKRGEIIPAVMKLADIFERCESKKTKQLVVYELTRVAGLLMRKQELADFVQLFLQWSFNSGAGEEETERRIGAGWKELTPPEKVVLALFDLIDSKYQPRVIKACQKLSSTERRPDWWFIPES